MTHALDLLMNAGLFFLGVALGWVITWAGRRRAAARYAAMAEQVGQLATERSHLALLLRARMTDDEWAKLPTHLQSLVSDELDRLVHNGHRLVALRGKATDIYRSFGLNPKE